MSGFADHERYDALGLVDLVQRKDVSHSDLLEAAIKRVQARQRRRTTRRSSGWPGKLEQARPRFDRKPPVASDPKALVN